MVISRTPYRISFFGGGTDYPVWFREHGGAVLSTTIDKYCYIFLRELPPFFDHKYSIVWSRIEHVNSIEEIFHPSVRECLRFVGIKQGLAVHHEGDLPARAGIGSSSAFTVGLLNSLYAFQGKMVGRMELALAAIHVEQDLLRENVGCQDQISAAFGGLNVIEFQCNNEFVVKPVTIGSDRLEELQSRCLLFFTGLSRTASEIAAQQIKTASSKSRELTIMREMVTEATRILTGNEPLKKFGQLLHESWKLKRSLTPLISNSRIDGIYEKGITAGAWGGKILGAGGGGFILFLAPPERHGRIRNALKELLEVPVKFEDSGSRIIFFSREETRGS
ncbi:MAG TPA: kinase [bacterium]|nr:kinase [bacterium]